MEATLGLRELITLITVVGGGYATVRVIETKISRIIEDISEVRSRLKSGDDRLDTVETGKGVTENQVGTFKDMLSPSERDKRSRELADMQRRIIHIEECMTCQRKL